MNESQPAHLSSEPIPGRRPWTRLLGAGGIVLTLLVGILAFPRDGATLEPFTFDGWSTSATPSVDVVRRGDEISFIVTAWAATARTGLIDIEINDADGRKVFQDFWNDETFTARQTRTYETTWTVPAGEKLGRHVVRLGVFRAGWGVLYHWHHVAATFDVVAANTPAPTTTTTPPAPTTTAATTTTRPPAPTTTVAATTTTRPPAPTTTVAATTTTRPPAPTTTRPPTPTTTTPPPTTPPPTTSPPTTAPPVTTPPPAGSQFTATFETAGDFYDRFVTHVGNACNANQSCEPEDHPEFAVQTFPGSHNDACEAPPSNRTVSIANHANLFWWCAPNGPATGHVMTGLNTSGYALVSFSPDRAFTDVSRVCWTQSLADLGGGKWNNVVLVPEATYRRHPNLNPDRVAEREGPYRLDYLTPGFGAGGPGDFNLHEFDGLFGVKQFRGTLGIYEGHEFIANWEGSWTAGTDQSTRYQHCFIDNGNGTVTISQQRATGTVTRTTAGAFPDGAVRVIFQDDTYDADKHGGTGLYTWHWDNITIS